MRSYHCLTCQLCLTFASYHLYLCIQHSKRYTSLLRVSSVVQPGSNKSIRVQMEMDDGHCSCDGYLCAPLMPLHVLLALPNHSQCLLAGSRTACACSSH